MKSPRFAAVPLLLGFLMAAVPLLAAGLAPAQGGISVQPIIESRTGPADEIGVAPILVTLTLVFSRPVARGDIEGGTLTINGVDVTRRAMFPSGWTSSSDRALTRTAALADLLPPEVNLGDNPVVRVTCRLKLRNQPAVEAPAGYDFQAFKPVPPPEAGGAPAATRAPAEPTAGTKLFKSCDRRTDTDSSLGAICLEYRYAPNQGSRGCLIDGPLRIYTDKGMKIADVDYRDGYRDGFYRTYHKDGNPAVSGAFQAGRKTGTWTWWYENGRKAYEIDFSRDEENGSYKSWYENGRTKEAGTCVRGAKSGRWSSWDEEGNAQPDAVFNDGRTGVYSPSDAFDMVKGLLVTKAPDDCAGSLRQMFDSKK